MGYYRFKIHLLRELHIYLLKQHIEGNIRLCNRWLNYRNHFIADLLSHYSLGYSLVHLYNDKPLGPYNYRLVSVNSFTRDWQNKTIKYNIYKG